MLLTSYSVLLGRQPPRRRSMKSMKHIHQACKPSCYSLRTRSYSRPTEYEEYDMPTPKTARLHARVATLYTLLCAGWSNTEYQGSTDPPGVALILQEYEKSADGGTALRLCRSSTAKLHRRH